MAQPVAWSFQVVSLGNAEYRVELTSVCEDDWYMYATVLPSDEGPLPTSFRFMPAESYTLVDSLVEPDPVEQYDPNFAMMVRYHDDTTRFSQRIKAMRAGPFTVEGQLEYMCCNSSTCLPPLVVPFSIPVSSRTPQNDR
ncbi:MAG: protein-disulfide reductase DsbD domain-containing protein [Flavobacteriales bacterium]